MALSKLTTVLNKISTMDTVIRDQASTVKAELEHDVNVVKDFINNTLTTEIDTTDAENVKKTGDQTIDGVKTFVKSPIVPAPTADMQTSTKKYVDDMGTNKTNDLNTHKDSADHDERYFTETELGSIVDNESGADKIGVTPIPTLTGENIQAILESIKDRFDDIGETNTNVELSNSHYGANGQTYSSVGARCDAIDAALVEVNGTLTEKASQVELNATNANVALKADKSEVTNVMTPKGNLAYALLPTTGNTVGWYYYCPDGDGTHGAGNYVWNGTVWYFGGTGDEGYNKVKNDINNLTPNGYSMILIDKKPFNMIRINTLIPNHYVGTDGKEAESDSFYLTEYINVNGISEIKLINCGLSCWYDSNKNFLSYFFVDRETFQVPANAYYIRSSIPTASINFAMISKESIIPYYDNGYIKFTDIYPQKKDYESGYINFTVPVNQFIFDQSITSDTTNDQQNIVDVDCILTLPNSYKNVGKPTKLLMMCHGAGKGVSGLNNWTENTDYASLVSYFTLAGYAIFDCNGYDNTSSGHEVWGAQRGIEAWRKAYQYVVDNYNVERSFSIYGFSMGGCTALNLAFQKLPNINSIIVSSPVINLEACFNEDIGMRSSINTAFGMIDVNTIFQDVMRLQSPLNRVVTINSVDYCFDYIPPIRIYYGGNEISQNGVNKEYAIRLHNAIKNAGGYSQYREVDGRGHEICYGGDNAITMEYVIWFNRYTN